MIVLMSSSVIDLKANQWQWGACILWYVIPLYVLSVESGLSGTIQLFENDSSITMKTGLILRAVIALSYITRKRKGFEVFLTQKSKDDCTLQGNKDFWFVKSHTSNGSLVELDKPWSRLVP